MSHVPESAGNAISSLRYCTKPSYGGLVSGGPVDRAKATNAECQAKLRCHQHCLSGGESQVLWIHGQVALKEH